MGRVWKYSSWRDLNSPNIWLVLVLTASADSVIESQFTVERWDETQLLVATYRLILRHSDIMILNIVVLGCCRQWDCTVYADTTVYNNSENWKYLTLPFSRIFDNILFSPVARGSVSSMWLYWAWCCLNGDICMIIIWPAHNSRTSIVLVTGLRMVAPLLPCI